VHLDTAVKSWRPKGWKNSYKDLPIVHLEWDDGRVIHYSPPVIYEAGADDLYDALWKMAKESPTGTFTLDTNTINIYNEEDNAEDTD